jgi:hypothetical protein
MCPTSIRVRRCDRLLRTTPLKTHVSLARHAASDGNRLVNTDASPTQVAELASAHDDEALPWVIEPVSRHIGAGREIRHARLEVVVELPAYLSRRR